MWAPAPQPKLLPNTSASPRKGSGDTSPLLQPALLPELNLQSTYSGLSMSNRILTARSPNASALPPPGGPREPFLSGAHRHNPAPALPTTRRSRTHALAFDR